MEKTLDNMLSIMKKCSGIALMPDSMDSKLFLFSMVIEDNDELIEAVLIDTENMDIFPVSENWEIYRFADTPYYILAVDDSNRPLAAEALLLAHELIKAYEDSLDCYYPTP